MMRRRQWYRAAQHLVKHPRDWWHLTWIIVGVVAVVAGAFAEQVKGEPVILALCVAMILLAWPGRVARAFAGILAAVAALLAVAQQGKFGLRDPDLWLFLTILVGVSAFIALVLVLIRQGVQEGKEPPPTPTRGIGWPPGPPKGKE